MIDVQAIKRADALLRRRRPLTRGCRLFRCVTQHVSLAEVAARCHVSAVSASYWRSGRVTPRPGSLKALEHIYGIPCSSWQRTKEI